MMPLHWHIEGFELIQVIGIIGISGIPHGPYKVAAPERPGTIPFIQFRYFGYVYAYNGEMLFHIHPSAISRCDPTAGQILQLNSVIGDQLREL